MLRLNIPLLCVLVLLGGCMPKPPEDVNIGFIGPLSGNAVDLGDAPAKAMALAVKLYNEGRSEAQPKVNFYYEDDEWNGENAVPLYDKLRREYDIDVLLLSHTDGTIALQDKVLKDGVVMINSLNNDQLLSTMNENTFTVGKKTEEAAQVVAARVIELGKKKVAGFHVDNNFMTIYAQAFAEHLSTFEIDSNIVSVDIDKEDYTAELNLFREEGCDALVFFGYKNLGYAMKQARDLGMHASFYASTTTLGKGYFENSEGAMIGTEFSFFTANDGNYILARQFLDQYRLEYGDEPFSVWPPMQAYDAMNIVLGIVETFESKPSNVVLNKWIRDGLLATNYYQGVCGNLAILEDGTSRGIYFALYVVKDNGVIEKVKR